MFSLIPRDDPKTSGSKHFQLWLSHTSSTTFTSVFAIADINKSNFSEEKPWISYANERLYSNTKLTEV